MTEEKIAQEYKNIPNSSLVVLDKVTARHNCRVDLIATVKLLIPMFSIIQFIEGAEQWSLAQKFTVQILAMKLVIKLSKSIPMISKDGNFEFALTYEELIILRLWLEARMKHCEKERDDRTPIIDKDGFPIPGQYKFNPDSYIAMKLLLLDIRELMLGNIILEE